MKELLSKGSIVLVLGTGGVGKTTVAAALGLAAAARPLNTTVLTIDPSRRLRDALGLRRLGGRPHRLGAARLRAAGMDPSISLSAMVLDVKGAWDGLVERFAADAATRSRILHNPFYRSLTERFAGSEAYAALEQLHDLHESGSFDIEIVDTPPAAHAFEFLQAPARMTRLLDSRTARWLFTPYVSAGRLAARLASRAARFVVRELERFAGASALSSISEFFIAAADTVDQLLDRLRKTEALLHSPAVRFVLVTTAERSRLGEARLLVEQMKQQGLRLSAVVVNRFLDEESWSELALSGGGPLEHLAEIGRLREIVGNSVDHDREVGALVRYLEDYRSRLLDEIDAVARLAADLPPQLAMLAVPEIQVGVRDLGALAKIARFLTGAGYQPGWLSKAGGERGGGERRHSITGA